MRSKPVDPASLSTSARVAEVQAATVVAVSVTLSPLAVSGAVMGGPAVDQCFDLAVAGGGGAGAAVADGGAGGRGVGGRLGDVEAEGGPG